jgi:predicted HD phosphohydrolase
MKLLTVQSVTQEALKILNRSFNDSYAKQYRTHIGGNEYIHGQVHRSTGKVDATYERDDHTQDAARYALGYKTQGL